MWKDDWPTARQALSDWWGGRGLAVCVTAPKDEPWEPVPAPPIPDRLEDRWLDPVYRVQAALHELAHTYCGGVAFPLLATDVGPGSLGLFLGCAGRLDETTVWYEPCIGDPESAGPLALDVEGRWWRRHVALIAEATRCADGRCLVGMPDLIENLDTLAQLRGPQQVLLDLVERPNWVAERIQEINAAFFRAFDAFRQPIADEAGGNSWGAFRLWGPGRTAKVQCDIGCAISPAMFRRVVQPALAEQCEWLDFAMFHLDGTNAIPQLDNLLAIDSLRAIEWTPQAGLPGGGAPEWYPLYRRIRSGGKAVQAVEVLPVEVEPLIDAVGPEGLFIMTHTATEAEARDLLRRTGWPGA
ncbi:MAG: hypothetical protein IT208_08735 [Chthonomonadales bacterium]|nr:hypothetical protein [Chthonomonadales bacterium]